MLRISVLNDPSATRFKLEGKLAHEWVAVAEKAWTALLNISPRSPLVVDLNSVSFVDDSGRDLLAQFHSAGARLVGTGPWIGALIEEITDNGANGRFKPGTWTKGILGLLFFLLLASLAFGQEPQSTSSSEVLTLDQAVSVALAHNRQLLIAALEVEKAELDVDIAKTKRLPQLSTDLYASGLPAPISFQVDAGTFGTYPATGPIPIVRQVTEEYGKEHPSKERQGSVLKSLTTFAGGGGPRFWFSVSPELQQLNYAQVIIQVSDKHDTNHLVDKLQAALSAGIPGARIDVRQLETGASVGIPVSIRLSGEDTAILQKEADQLKQILLDVPMARRVRDDWGSSGINILVDTYSDRANLAGISNQDVATSSSAATTGTRLTTLRDGDKQVPVVAKLRMEERATLSDLESLYIGSSQSAQKVPIGEVASLTTQMRPEKIRRRAQFRTITVSAFPREGHLPSELLSAAMPGIKKLEARLPIGYHLAIGGEFEEQQKGFKSIAKVMAISISAIFLALVFQFRNAVKPIIVFGAIPYGMVGALAALWITGTPFGFMAFLGIASLVGVIVSHVIVLFDFIEEAHERGETLRESLLAAGIVRLRPVMITVGATVIALFPLAAHGGPLWEPLCYAQIGGLSVATFITLLLVPVMYAIFVLDLKWVKWQKPTAHEHETNEAAPEPIPVQARVATGSND